MTSKVIVKRKKNKRKSFPKKSNATVSTFARSRPYKWGGRSSPIYYSMGIGAFAVGIALLVYESYDLSRHENGHREVIPRKHKIMGLSESESTFISPLASKAYPLHKSKAEILDSEFKDAEGLSFQEKISYWSSFIENDAEGRKKIETLAKDHKVSDLAPLVPQKYDCTTYVETVAALSRSSSKDSFVNNLIAIRYREGHDDFINRNHFPELDWIPNNERAQILKDVTQKLAQETGVSSKIEAKIIDRAKWLKAQMKRHGVSRNIASDQVWEAPKEVRLPYIEMSEFKKVMHEIPSGTVINIVRRNDDRHPLLIAHQGFVIHEGNRVFIRHASPDGRIRTKVLKAYLEDLNRIHSKRWPVIGINLNQINDSISVSSFRRDDM